MIKIVTSTLFLSFFWLSKSMLIPTVMINNNKFRSNCYGAENQSTIRFSTSYDLESKLDKREIPITDGILKIDYTKGLIFKKNTGEVITILNPPKNYAIDAIFQNPHNDTEIMFIAGFTSSSTPMLERLFLKSKKSAFDHTFKIAEEDRIYFKNLAITSSGMIVALGYPNNQNFNNPEKIALRVYQNTGELIEGCNIEVTPSEEVSDWDPELGFFGYVKKYENKTAEIGILKISQDESSALFSIFDHAKKWRIRRYDLTNMICDKEEIKIPEHELGRNFIFTSPGTILVTSNHHKGSKSSDDMFVSLIDLATKKCIDQIKFEKSKQLMVAIYTNLTIFNDIKKFYNDIEFKFLS